MALWLYILLKVLWDRDQSYAANSFLNKTKSLLNSYTLSENFLANKVLKSICNLLVDTQELINCNI